MSLRPFVWQATRSELREEKGKRRVEVAKIDDVFKRYIFYAIITLFLLHILSNIVFVLISRLVPHLHDFYTFVFFLIDAM